MSDDTEDCVSPGRTPMSDDRIEIRLDRIEQRLGLVEAT